MPLMRKGPPLLLLLALVASAPLAADLPPVPVPAENPITEQKRVLGKILFWDEQLSSDGTVACGTCHRPGAGGGDPRAGRQPGRRQRHDRRRHGLAGHRRARPRRPRAAAPPLRHGTASHAASRTVELRRDLGRRALLGWTCAIGAQRSVDGQGRDRARRRARESSARRAAQRDRDGESRPLVGRRRGRPDARSPARARDELASRYGGRDRAAFDAIPRCSRPRSATARSRRCASRSRSRRTNARSSPTRRRTTASRPATRRR